MKKFIVALAVFAAMVAMPYQVKACNGIGFAHVGAFVPTFVGVNTVVTPTVASTVAVAPVAVQTVAVAPVVVPTVFATPVVRVRGFHAFNTVGVVHGVNAVNVVNVGRVRGRSRVVTKTVTRTRIR